MSTVSEVSVKDRIKAGLDLIAKWEANIEWMTERITMQNQGLITSGRMYYTWQIVQEQEKIDAANVIINSLRK